MTAISLPSIAMGVSFGAASRRYTTGPDEGEAHGVHLPSGSASISIDASLQRIAEQVWALKSECAQDGWDGYGAAAVTDETLAQALTLLQLLPTTAPEPHVSAHPDGDVGFTWAYGPRRILSVAISATGRLSFASLNGHKSLYGREYLVSKLPESVALALRDILSASDAEPVRQASRAQ